MSSNEISTVKDLVKVLHDGVTFYTDAKIELKGSGYESALQEMIDARQQALARLQPLIFLREGETEPGTTISGSLHKTYTDILAAIKSNKSQVYIAQLEELEDRTLEYIQKAQYEAVSIDIKTALNYTHKSLRQCHDRMRSLKRSAA
ncbi:PA2169 family four-helix-bundle protein [Cellvibrio sp. UBA7671]|uniref:PA2169 family four-helix-bundle protein n=1 Tax=Cellvibrio sp. UBA7671 TaxID=1946312 RepID=UPI002F35C9D6